MERSWEQSRRGVRAHRRPRRNSFAPLGLDHRLNPTHSLRCGRYSLAATRLQAVSGCFLAMKRTRNEPLLLDCRLRFIYGRDLPECSPNPAPD